MSISVRLPDLDQWKAQVKCQAGCPVATDAGRYVQLIAEGRDEEAYLVARAPNPFASVCGRVCAAASRVLIAAVLLNPSGALRTGAGTAAFGAGSLALLRFTRGPFGAGLLIALSLLFWTAVPTLLAARRLDRVDV